MYRNREMLPHAIACSLRWSHVRPDLIREEAPDGIRPQPDHKPDRLPPRKCQRLLCLGETAARDQVRPSPSGFTVRDQIEKSNIWHWMLDLPRPPPPRERNRNFRAFRKRSFEAGPDRINQPLFFTCGQLLLLSRVLPRGFVGPGLAIRMAWHKVRVDVALSVPQDGNIYPLAPCCSFDGLDAELDFLHERHELEGRDIADVVEVVLHRHDASSGESGVAVKPDLGLVHAHDRQPETKPAPGAVGRLPVAVGATTVC